MRWIQITEEFNFRIAMGKQRTPVTSKSKRRQLKREFPLPAPPVAIHLAEKNMPSLNVLPHPSERSHLVSRPISVRTRSRVNYLVGADLLDCPDSV